MMKSKSQHRQISVRSLMIGIAVLAILLGGAAWLWREVQEARGQTRRMIRASYLKHIGLALHNYHATYGRLPPAYTLDDQGRPLTSWRVLILPYLDEPGLYAQYDQSKPWDSPENLPLVATAPDLFRDRYLGSASETAYLAIVGHGTPINSHGHVDSLKARPDWSADIMVIHSSDHAVPWTKPEDFDPADAPTLISEDENPLRAAILMNAITEYRFLTEADRKQILKYTQPPADSLPPSSPTEPRQTE